MRKFNYYPFEQNKNGKTYKCIAAVTRFRGHTVRGVAVCSPEDPFNYETGKDIAALKCMQKINQQRIAYFAAEYDHALRDIQLKEQYAKKTHNKLDSAIYELNQTNIALEKYQ